MFLLTPRIASYSPKNIYLFFFALTGCRLPTIKKSRFSVCAKVNYTLYVYYSIPLKGVYASRTVQAYYYMNVWGVEVKQFSSYNTFSIKSLFISLRFDVMLRVLFISSTLFTYILALNMTMMMMMRTRNWRMMAT